MPFTTVKDEMRRFYDGELHSGSGKVVTNRKQAIAIALSEQKKKSRGKTLMEMAK